MEIKLKQGSELTILNSSDDSIINIDESTKSVTIDGKSVDKLVEIAWADLKSLRDNSQLVPGTFYRITDYECTTIQANTSSAGHIFDIIVLAGGVNKLNENAYAIQHAGDTYFSNSKLEAWQLKYCLDNDTTRFAWADSTNGKGVIYKMIDEFNNDVPYDFKNILFKFKKYLIAGTWVISDYTYIRNSSLDASGYYGWSAIESVSYEAPTNLYTNTENPSTDSQLFSDTSGTTLSQTIKKVSLDDFLSYTFNLVVSSSNTDVSLQGLSKECHSNIIGVYVLNSVQTLNKTVFRLSEDSQGRVYCYANDISSQNHDNLFTGRNYYSNTIGSNFYSNTIGFEFSYNSIDSNFYSNTIDSDFSGNTTGSDFSGNTTGRSFYDNIIGVKFKSNITEGEFLRNTIGPNCSSNTFGSDKFSSISSNTLGPNCSSNTIGSDFKNNTIGSDFKSNTLGSRFQYNIIGSNCSSNIIGSRFQYSTIGSYFRNNTIGASASDNVWVRYCKFDEGIQYTSLTSNDTSASSSNQLQNIHIHSGVNGSSSSNRRTITVDRGLAYSTDIYAKNSQNITLND